MTTVSELQTVLTADDTQLKQKLNQSDGRIADFARSANTRLGKMARNFTVWGAGAALALGGAAVKASIDWESSFADVRKTVSDLNDEELEDLEEQLRGLATTGVTGSLANAHSELAQIAALGGQLGVAGESLDEFTTTVAAFGVATDSLSTEEAAVFFAQFANITGLDVAKDVDNIADAVVHLGNNTATNEGKIAQFGLRLGQLSNVGFSPDEILGWGAAMASLGISAELGSTNFALSIADMQRAAREGGTQLDLFAETAGMAADEFAELSTSDPSSAFEAVIQGLARLDPQEAQQRLDELGVTGTEQRRVMLTLAGGINTVTDALYLSAEGFSGNNAAMTEAEAKADTTQGKINELKNKMRDLGITIGDNLVPNVTLMISGLNNLLSGNHGAALEELSAGFILLAGAVGGFTQQETIEGFRAWGAAFSMLPDVLETVIGQDSDNQSVIARDMQSVEFATTVEVEPENIDYSAVTNAISNDTDGMSIFERDMRGVPLSIEVEAEVVPDVTPANEDLTLAYDAVASGLSGMSMSEPMVLEPDADLELPISDMTLQAEDGVTEAVEMGAYSAIVAVDMVLTPGSIDSSQIDAAVASAASGVGGGGDTYVINSYGENSVELSNNVRRSNRDRGPR